MGMEQESGHRRDYKGYSTQMNRETGGGSGTEVENWDQFKRAEIRGVRSELKGLISDSAKTLVIMNKEFKNTPDSVKEPHPKKRGNTGR
jgi:hypothetical protein